MKIKTKLNSSLKATLLLLAILCLPTNAFAYYFQVDGIYYSINEDDSTTVSVASGEEYYDEETGEYVYNDISGNITIPSTVMYNGITYTVTAIESRAFYGDKALTGISIPETITEIGWDAFYNTGYYMNQPDGIVYLDSWAINYKGDLPENPCLNIKPGTIGIADGALGGDAHCSAFHSNETIEIPNSVLYIGGSAFERILCGVVTSTKSIVIGKSVKVIGGDAFYMGSYGWPRNYDDAEVTLQSITCLATEPPKSYGAFVGWNAFGEKRGGWTEYYEDWDYNIYYKVPLYVPHESVNAYREAEDWSRFKTIIGISVTNRNDVNGDDEVTVSDINEVVDVITQGTSHPNYTNCDVNEDGEVSVADINSIINAIVGD